MKIVSQGPERADVRPPPARAEAGRAAFKRQARVEKTNRSGVTLSSSLLGTQSASPVAAGGFDAAKVERLRTALAEGRLEPDATTIAKNLVEEN